MLKHPLLIVLTGLPAAGKTTLADHLGALLDTAHGVPAMIIDSDTVRQELVPLRRAFDPELEPAVRRMTLDRIASALAQRISVIHDDLNYYRSMRFDLVELSRESQACHALIHLAAPASDCLKNNAARGHTIPDVVIEKDAERFDPPGLDPWDEPIAVFGSPPLDTETVKTLAAELVERANNHVPWEPSAETPHEHSPTELLDLLARKVVADLYKAGRPNDSGQAISKRRHELVQQALADGLHAEAAETLFKVELGSLFE